MRLAGVLTETRKKDEEILLQGYRGIKKRREEDSLTRIQRHKEEKRRTFSHKDTEA